MAGLLAAWLGVWATWLAGPSAGLTQAALDVAQVAERLPEVLYGRLGVMPDLLRASVGLASVALAVEAANVQRGWVRWGLRGLALLLVARLLPPYPFILDGWRSPDYGGRFVLAVAGLVLWAASLTGGRWPSRARHAMVAVTALAALAGGLWAFVALRHAFAASTQLPFAPGWGLALYVSGLLVACVDAGLALVRES